MKKNTFYSLFFVAMLTGCAVIESSPIYGSEAIRTAELGTSSETTQTATKDKNPDYIIILDQDSLRVRKADTKEIIFVGSWEEKTQLNEAIFRDNL